MANSFTVTCVQKIPNVAIPLPSGQSLPADSGIVVFKAKYASDGLDGVGVIELAMSGANMAEYTVGTDYTLSV